MRIIFMGTAALACPCLETLAALPAAELVLVVTQPDRPQGRHLQLAPPPVKVTANALGLPLVQPDKIRRAEAIDTVRAAQPDLVVVVAYGQLLPAALLEIPPFGCVNVHASLLPRWRGAAPIQYAILNGDEVTGVTTMYLNEQMDAGDIILQREEPIRADDTSGGLHDRLAVAGAALLAETIHLVDAGTAPRRPQAEPTATYARKITKEQGRIDWSRPACEIERQVRAFNPWPSAYTEFAGGLLKIWRATVVDAAPGQPGELGRDGVVTTGAGGLQLLEVQPAGSKRMSFDAFQCGHALEPGLVLGAKPTGADV